MSGTVPDMRHLLRPLLFAPVLVALLAAGYLLLLPRLVGGLCVLDSNGNPPAGIAAAACNAAWTIVERLNQDSYSKFDKTPPGRLASATSDPARGPLPTAVAFDTTLPPVLEWRSVPAPTQPLDKGPFPNSELQGRAGAWRVTGAVGHEQSAFPAYLAVVGYIVVRERLADGTVRFAVAIPTGAVPFAPSDLAHSLFTVRQKEAGEQPGMATGLVVWVRLWSALGFFERPLVTDVSWKTKLAQDIPASAAAASGPAFEYSRPGDLVMVRVALQAESYDNQALVDNYQSHQNANGLAYDAAVSAYQAALTANAASLARIVADAGAKVTLGQQLADRRYEFVASSFDFVPGP